MEALMTVIVMWLATNSGLPADYDHPEIKFVSAADIYKVRYGVPSNDKGTKVISVYDTPNATIMLPDDWAAESVADISILVHEMVHHLQHRAGITYACAGMREAPAYAAQAKWLEQFGTNLESEFGIDNFSLKAMTICNIP